MCAWQFAKVLQRRALGFRLQISKVEWPCVILELSFDCCIVLWQAYRLQKAQAADNRGRHVFDVSQDPDFKLSASLKDGAFFCFSRNTRPYCSDKQMFLSPNQMMRAMGWQMTPEDVRAASLPALQWKTCAQMAVSCELTANAVRGAARDA